MTPSLPATPFAAASAAGAFWGYVGPGAGFAFLSSFLFILAAVAAVAAVFLTLPVRLLIRAIRFGGKKTSARGRVVIIGLDGLDPVLAASYMDRGLLPRLSGLRERGSFLPMLTTNPPISPVAWSSLLTGVNPGKHNIFDFIHRDPLTYLPRLSAAEVVSEGRRKPRIRLLRKSRPFWTILGERGVFSAALKVPITFPPEPFPGLALSGLGTPDLRGSQGSFTLFATRKAGGERMTGGYQVALEGAGPVWKTRITGPPRPGDGAEPLSIPLRIEIVNDGGAVDLRWPGDSLRLEPGRLSPWKQFVFRFGLRGRIRGVAQVFVKSLHPHLEIYLSPINIDPARPALPVSHPFIYSVYLSRLFGTFPTLGLPQDTWALNEGVLTEDGFLQQTWDAHRRLERIFFHTLGQVRRGLVFCVFDTSDVIQHEFWRYLGGEGPRAGTIEELYRRMDRLVGETLNRLGPEDTLLVVSDHGFKDFRRGVHLNAWLHDRGYLVLKEGAGGKNRWLADVDWSRTRAYSLGLSGIYLNLKGREKDGTVPNSAAAVLKRELAAALKELSDPAGGEGVVEEVYDRQEIYEGPYRQNAPDLIVGFRPPYRVSWESAQGEAAGEIFSDNEKAWSADHCLDHKLVPGVFFSNRPLNAKQVSLTDIAPTVLRLFDIDPPAYLDGRALELSGRPGGREGKTKPAPRTAGETKAKEK